MRSRIARTTLRALLPLLAIGFVADWGARLQGYATNGHTWPTSSVTYYVNPQSIYVSSSAAISAAQQAAAVWRNQSSANINLVYAGTTSGSSLIANSKNEVFFRNGSNGSNVAETYYWWDANGRLFDADIVLYEAAFQFFTGSGCLNGVYVEDVLAHEFGHVLGLAHSSVAGATMAPAMPTYCDLTQLTLEADDISGIESLYPPTGNPPNTAPSVTITSPANLATFAANTSINFSGTANDTQDGNLNTRLTWVSSLSGTIGTGASFTRVLTAGTHVITASAMDNGGLTGSKQITITVSAAPAPNSPPVVAIATPANNSSYPSNAAISFTGSANDTQDGNISAGLVWTSNLIGQIGTGPSFARTLSAGTHVITATAIDAGGLSGFAQLTMVVTVSTPPPVDTAPVITILAPVSTGSYVEGTPITFTGTAIDVPEGDISSRLWWTSSLVGEIGTGPTFTRTLPAGTHVITTQAGDNSGFSAFKQVTIVVAAATQPPPPPPPPGNTAPVVTIVAPVSTGSYVAGTPITFTGTAIDAQEGDISSRLWWTSNLAGELGTGPTFAKSLSAGTHIITVQAGDNGGLSAFKQVTIVVSTSQAPPPANTPPVVTILSPLSTGSYTTTTNISFSGTAIDVPDGDVSSRLVWTSNVSGVIGTGASFSRTLAAGTHVITVSASDNNNQSGFSQVTITVASSQPATNITLSARGTKDRGFPRVDLTWTGATTSTVDVYRNGVIVGTPSNTGSWTDVISRKGAGTYVYSVCNSGTTTCSPQVTVIF